MKRNILLKTILVLTLIVTVIAPFSYQETSAASYQTGTIDITSGKLNVRNAPNSKAKIIGTLKRSDKVKVLSQSKSGWTTLQYGKGKGYISSNYVRFYKTTSLYSVKKVTDRVIGTERDMWKKTFTKQQFYNMMSPAFTKEYLDLYFKEHIWKVGKDKSGNTLYAIRPTDIYGLCIDEFDWYLQYETKKPEVVFYHKNGIEYLVVSQFHKYDELTSSHKTYLYLIKKPKSSWKVYKIERVYSDS